MDPAEAQAHLAHQEATIAAMSENIRQLTEMARNQEATIRALSEAVHRAATTATPPPSTAAVLPSSIPIAVPERYNGSPEWCRNFLMQCSMYFTYHPAQFPTERQKVHFMLSFLTGEAGAWGTALWDSGDPSLESEALFSTLFRSVFDHPAAGRDVGTQLCDIKHGRRSAADYAREFRTLAAGSGWGESALKTDFRHGLKTELQVELACRSDDLSLADFIQAAVNMDKVLTTHHPAPGRSRWATPPVQSSRSLGEMSCDFPEPMQLGRSPLTPRERARHI